jgi:DNA-binding PadR family transcriptional regulator
VRPPRGRFFGTGELRLALLSLLVEDKAHGYELMTRLETRLGGAYKASAGAIYPTLQLLEDEGLVKVGPLDGKKVYAPTAAGKAEVEARTAEIAAIWRRADEWSDWGDLHDPQSAEVIGPALRLTKAAIKATLKSRGDPAVIEAVRAILDDARDRIERVTKRGRR